MHKWRKYLIFFTLLMVIIGGVVCYDVYRAQTVAIDTLKYATSHDLNRLEPLIQATAITNGLYKDIEPFAEVAPPPEAPRERGFIGRIWDRGEELLGRKPADQPATAQTIDLHLCAQAIGEPKGFSALLAHLKPLPVKGGWKPDPRIHYGSLNARQYLIRDTSTGGNYLVVSRNGLLDWKITGIKLTDTAKRQVAKTCVGVI